MTDDRDRFENMLRLARDLLDRDPALAFMQIRKTGESAMRLVLAAAGGGNCSTLAFNELLIALNKAKALPLRIQLHLETIQRWGNAATHGKFDDDSAFADVVRADVEPALAALVLVVEWVLCGHPETRPTGAPSGPALRLTETWTTPVEEELRRLDGAPPPRLRLPLDRRPMGWVPTGDGPGGVYVDLDPVRSHEWTAFVASRPGDICWEDPWLGTPHSDGFPVSGISHVDAMVYAAAQGKRLPTRAQWRAAAAAGVAPVPAYPWGPAFASSRCNHGDTRRAFGPSPVERYPPQNAIGVRDIVGNFYELVHLGDAGWGACGGDYRQPPERLTLMAEPITFVAPGRTISFRCIATLDDVEALIAVGLYPLVPRPQHETHRGPDTEV